MNTSKLNLKILDKTILLILVLFTSCTTTTLTSHSEDVIAADNILNSEFNLPLIAIFNPGTLTASTRYNYGKRESSKEIELLHTLSYNTLGRPYVNDSPLFIKSREIELPVLPFYIIKPVVKIVPKPVAKVVTKPVAKAVPKPIAKKSVNSSVANRGTTEDKPTTKTPTLPMIKEVAVPESQLIVLNDMSAVVGKSFTIEMDQTGWIYESEIKGLHFKNKFYTSDRVLFEFIANTIGQYSVEFVKYTTDIKQYSHVNIEVFDKDVVFKDVESKDDSQNSTQVIVPEKTIESISNKDRLEKALLDIKNQENQDEIYFQLAQIYFEEGLLKKSKEFYEYVYDNYPFSIHYNESKERMEYILDNFLKVR